jgi:hypothetical protein
MEYEYFSRIVSDHGNYVWPGSSDISEFDLEISLDDSLTSIRNEMKFIEKPKKIKFANLGFKTICKLIVMHLSGEPLERLQEVAKLSPEDDIVLKLIVDVMDENDCCMYFIMTLRENSMEDLYMACEKNITQLAKFLGLSEEFNSEDS